MSSMAQYEAVALILTTDALIIVNTDEDVPHRLISLSELSSTDNNDPTLLALKLSPPMFASLKNNEEDCTVEMDPACRARVADYVRNTVGLLQLPSDFSPEHSEMSISPLLTPSTSIDGNSHEQALTFYVNPQNKNYFLSMLLLAKQQLQDYSFPIL